MSEGRDGRCVMRTEIHVSGGREQMCIRKKGENTDVAGGREYKSVRMKTCQEEGTRGVSGEMEYKCVRRKEGNTCLSERREH